MVKLYPPNLEGTLPAFYSDEKGIVYITIPFSMNRAVSQASVGGFELKIKTVQNSVFLHTEYTFDQEMYYINGTNSYVKFAFKDLEGIFKLGQFYKFQLAYWYIDPQIKNEQTAKYNNGSITLETYCDFMKEHGTQGYYSNASVAKFTSMPRVSIANLRPKFLNAYTNGYTGYYSQEDEEYNVLNNNGDVIYEMNADGQQVPKTITYKRDITEKVYSYRFDIYDMHENLVYTSGECIHNNSLDTNMAFSEDRYSLNADVPIDMIYFIQYTITTINKLTVSSPRYKLVKRMSINAELEIYLEAYSSFNNGYIDIQITNDRDESGLPTPVTGSFLLLRTDEDSNYNEWSELFRFKLTNECLPDSSLYKDFTVEQGKHYKYAIQQYNSNNLFSNKIESNIVYSDFEDAFLFDGQRQLKIRYNPKVSKFSNTRLETKVETIGNKYPFILRNGQVNYHEFNLSGLLSFLSDDEFLFLSAEELGIKDELHRHSTESHEVFPIEDSVSVNIARERLFKMKVLEWLNNGEPKVFRSPSEGNFIVRLMKISMTPQDKLGRMLHTFNSTAYEIADFTYDNLCGLNFLNPQEPNNKIINWVTLKLNDVIQNRGNQTINIDPNTNQTIKNIQTIRFTDMTPGEEIEIIFADGKKDIVHIGPTGNLFLDKVIPINSIRVLKKYQRIGTFSPLEYFDRKYYFRYLDQYYPYLDIDPITKQPAIIPDKTYQAVLYKQINEYVPGYMTFSYFVEQTPAFNSVSNVQVEDSMVQQFIGYHNILHEIAELPIVLKANSDPEKVVYAKNPKIDILNYYYLKVSRRPIESVQVIDNTAYHTLDNNISTQNTLMPVNYANKHPFTVYQAVYRYDSGIEVGKCFDTTPITNWDYQPYININDEIIYIDREVEIPLDQFSEITKLISGSGVVVEMGYLARQNEYYIESTHIIDQTNHKTMKQRYEEILNNFKNSLQYSNFKSNYNEYCEYLYNKLNE